MKDFQSSRRQWLKTLGGAALVAGLGRMNMFAQGSFPDYKALVCIFLSGGNDGHNTIIPQTQAQFNAYKAARGSLALPDNNGPIMPVTTTDGTPYALNSGLAAIHPFWAQNKLACLANVGMLVTKTSRQEYLNNLKPVPTNLFSHSDQIQQMQSGFPSTSGGTGWGGRAADLLQYGNGASTFPTALSISGPSLFCACSVIQSASLLPGFNLDASGMQVWPQAAAAGRLNGLQQLLQLDSGLALVQAANQSRKDALSLNAMLAGSNATLNTVFPGTGIGNQLQQVAKIIKLRGSTGMSRQVFFCSLGGFDTHGSQSWQQWDLLQDLAQAMQAFYTATDEMAIADKITQFTLSDFGRSLQPSGTGSDHGWGSHHFILGGAVNGGTMYGAFPNMALGGPDDSGSRGVMIPSTSIDQYGATLASWFGVPQASMSSVFPNINNFTTADLGFMGA